MVVRKDIGLEAIGTMSDFPPDHSPLQIGARGRCLGRSFQLLGRLRVGWHDGSWSEWYADLGEGRYGWLAEAEGLFMLSEATLVTPTLNEEIPHFQPEQKVKISGAIYTVAGMKSVHAIAGEGELPFVAAPGKEWISYDLSANGADFASAEFDHGERRLYIGKSMHPEEITWEGLKPVPGWNGEPLQTERNRTAALNCNACGGVVQMRAAGLTQTLACSHCGTLLDVNEPEAVLAQKVTAGVKQPPPPIPLGTRGKLRGAEWEAIGCIIQSDTYSKWHEILLYNPWRGFAWLTTYGGHWNFIRRVLSPPAGTSRRLVYKKNDYQLFAEEDVVTAHVAGEFYWRVRTGDITRVSDYIAPPHVLSCEAYPKLKEVTWSEGEYIDADEVGKAFHIQPAAKTADVYLNQPNPWVARAPSVKWVAIYALLAAIVLQLFFAFSKSSRYVLSQDFQYQKQVPAPTATAGAAPIVSETFEIKSSQAPATIDVHAPVDNAWLGLDVDLVNEASGKTYPAEAMVEYYHGYDDGYWSEGRQEKKTSLPAVPPGRYHLALSPEADSSVQQLPFRVQLQHGGLFWSNFWICFIAIGIWPAWVWFRKHHFEARRWEQSDYTPDAGPNLFLNQE